MRSALLKHCRNAFVSFSAYADLEQRGLSPDTMRILARIREGHLLRALAFFICALALDE